MEKETSTSISWQHVRESNNRQYEIKALQIQNILIVKRYITKRITQCIDSG